MNIRSGRLEIPGSSVPATHCWAGDFASWASFFLSIKWEQEWKRCEVKSTQGLEGRLSGWILAFQTLHILSLSLSPKRCSFLGWKGPGGHLSSSTSPLTEKKDLRKLGVQLTGARQQGGGSTYCEHLRCAKPHSWHLACTGGSKPGPSLLSAQLPLPLPVFTLQANGMNPSRFSLLLPPGPRRHSPALPLHARVTNLGVAVESNRTPRPHLTMKLAKGAVS